MAPKTRHSTASAGVKEKPDSVARSWLHGCRSGEAASVLLWRARPQAWRLNTVQKWEVPPRTGRGPCVQQTPELGNSFVLPMHTDGVCGQGTGRGAWEKPCAPAKGQNMREGLRSLVMSPKGLPCFHSHWVPGSYSAKWRVSMWQDPLVPGPYLSPQQAGDNG